jgi:hypothetical protein
MSLQLHEWGIHAVSFGTGDTRVTEVRFGWGARPPRARVRERNGGGRQGKRGATRLMGSLSLFSQGSRAGQVPDWAGDPVSVVPVT